MVPDSNLHDVPKLSGICTATKGTLRGMNQTLFALRSIARQLGRPMVAAPFEQLCLAGLPYLKSGDEYC